MLDRIKAIAKSKRFHYLMIYVSILAVFHVLMRHYDGDIEYYLRASWDDPVWNLSALCKLLYSRYIDQTSRVLLEAPVFLLTHGMHIYAFSILNILAHVIIYLGMTKLTDDRHNDLLLCLLLLYPVAEMNTAGWIVCYVIYFWPLATVIVSFNSLKDMYEGKKIRIPMMILYLLCLIFAANLEQFAFLYLGILVVFAGYMIAEHKFTPGYIVFSFLQLLAVIGNIIFSLTGPGNLGKVSYMGHFWFPDYDYLTLADKIVLAVNCSMPYLMERSLIWATLCALLFVAVITKNPGNTIRITVSAIPISTTILRSVADSMSERYFGDFNALFDVYSDVARVDSTNYNSFSAYFPFIFYMLIATIVLINIIWIAHNLRDAIFSVCIMLFAFGIRAMIAFSPTVYASSQRTFMVTEFIIIYLIVWIYTRQKAAIDTLPGWCRFISKTSVYIMTVFSVVNNLLAVTNAYYYGWK